MISIINKKVKNSKYASGLQSRKKVPLCLPIEQLTLDKHGVKCVTLHPFITKEQTLKLWELVPRTGSYTETRTKSPVESHKTYKIDENRFDLWDISLLNDLIPSTIDDLVLNNIGPTSCSLVRKSCGLLPLLKEQRSCGKWHRDIIPLFNQYSQDPNESELHTLLLPDFYYTVFIPLHLTNKSTDFVLSSHRVRASDIHTLSYSTIEHDKTQMLIMNGKLVHRGGMQDADRLLMYMIYCPMWYAEEKYINF